MVLNIRPAEIVHTADMVHIGPHGNQPANRFIDGAGLLEQRLGLGRLALRRQQPRQAGQGSGKSGTFEAVIPKRRDRLAKKGLRLLLYPRH